MVSFLIICLIIGLPLYGFWYQWRKANKLQKVLNKTTPLFDYVDEKDKEIESLTKQLERYREMVRACEKKLTFYHSVPEIDIAIKNALLHSKRGMYDISSCDTPGLSIHTDLTLNKPKKDFKSKDLNEDDINRLLDEMNNKQ